MASLNKMEQSSISPTTNITSTKPPTRVLPIIFAVLGTIALLGCGLNFIIALTGSRDGGDVLRGLSFLGVGLFCLATDMALDLLSQIEFHLRRR